MRRLTRTPLSPKSEAFLAKRTSDVRSSAHPKQRAAQLWQSQNVKAFKEIRQKLAQMASGLERCMYCEDSAGTDIEHFWPKSTYPKKAFLWLNYLWACSHCNSNQKRTVFPRSRGKPLLIDPTAEDPLDHLVLSPSTGKFAPISEKGTKSCQVFGLNRGTLETGRKNAWVALQSLLPSYAKCVQEGDQKEAERLRYVVTQHPFSSVLVTLLRIATGPDATLIRPECRSALQAHPEIQKWV
jgi:uncharacterized protein (TIGR02646 family)